MKPINNNFSALPFYANIEEQQHRRSYAYGQIYPLYAPNDRLLPFQVITPKYEGATVTTVVDLFTANDEYVCNILGGDGLTPQIIAYYTAQDMPYGVLINTGDSALADNLPEGQYYLRMSAGLNVYYSEVFTVVSRLDGYLRLSWWDEADFVMDAGRIVYTPISANSYERLYNRQRVALETGATVTIYVNNDGDAGQPLNILQIITRGAADVAIVAQYTDSTGAAAEMQLEKVGGRDDQYIVAISVGVLAQGLNAVTLKNTGADIEVDILAGRLTYGEQRYRNTVYICSQIGRPEYQFDEEGDTRDGFFFPQKQISEKVYKFTFIAAEYLLDAMRFVRLSDYVTIVDQYSRAYRADTFLMTPKWLPQGALASVDVEFQTDTVAKKLAWAAPMPARGAFSDDYNNDYAK